MPAWSDYKSEATSRGALAHELYVVQSVPSGDPADVKANLPAHLEYQANLERQGALVMAGPLSDDTGDLMEGHGMIIYRAESLAAARALAAADPMHASGARNHTVRRWLINEGSLTLTVKLAAQRVSLD